MTGRRQYSPEFKAEVVAYYVKHGEAAAVREFGVSNYSVQKWRKAAGAQCTEAAKNATEDARAVIQALREGIKAKLLRVADQVLDEMAEPDANARDRKDNATTVGILIDKYRLEAGEATGRQDIHHDFPARSDSDLIREAEDILRAAAH